MVALPPGKNMDWDRDCLRSGGGDALSLLAPLKHLAICFACSRLHDHQLERNSSPADCFDNKNAW